MSEPIIFKLTNAGKKAAFDANADTAVVHINIDRVVLGSGKYTPTGNETSIRTELARFDIVSGGVEVGSNTLRFSASMTANSLTPIHEIGLLTDTGVLFAVASRTSATPYFSLQPPIVFAGSFGLSLAELPASSINVVIDPEGAKSLIIMENHLAAPDPHPQYLNKNRFQLAMRALYPMGYQYHSHEPVNPKPIFDDILGLDTAWRRVTGKIFVSSDPSDPFINTYGLVLGQKGMTDVLASGARPHVYPLQTTHTFERYNPDDVIATVWKVVANKTAINEGGAVRFTVTANNLPDGQILNWSVKEGALNGSSNDITSPQKTDSGTVILRNGQAVIDFTTTPDDNVAEPQKHVRITIGAPANLSINVPITDAGHNETALHITQSTNNGIDLAEYYKQQSGSYPTATDKVRFIVDAGVDIVAPDTSTPAMIEGSNWTSGAEIVVENRGRILGRGGAGGLGAALLNGFSFRGSGSLGESFRATAGGNGGTAVKGNIEIDNYGVIAGGGGGGGGNGAYRFKYSDDYQVYMGSDSSGGGGAPFGEARYNRTHIESWFTEPTSTPAGISNLKSLFSAAEARIDGIANDGISNIGFGSEAQGATANYLRNTEYNYSLGSAATFLDSIGIDKTLAASPFAIAKPIPKTGFMNADSVNVTDAVFDDPHTYFIDTWTAGNSPTWFPSLPMYNPIDGALLTGGKGGLGFAATGSFVSQRALRAFKNKSYESFMRAGKGGDIGVSGEAGKLTHVSIYDQATPNTFVVTPIDSLPEGVIIKTLPAAAGGLAGYIKEGSVTITNFSGGTTKGR